MKSPARRHAGSVFLTSNAPLVAQQEVILQRRFDYKNIPSSGTATIRGATELLTPSKSAGPRQEDG